MMQLDCQQGHTLDSLNPWHRALCIGRFHPVPVHLHVLASYLPAIRSLPLCGE